MIAIREEVAGLTVTTGQGFSGMLYSHAGIITEMYDYCNFGEDRFGLAGFLNAGAAAYTVYAAGIAAERF